jgi:hypothetical protein
MESTIRTGAEFYYLANIVHNWDDGKDVSILRCPDL